MTNINGKPFHLKNYLFAWGVHLFTASGAFFGVLTLVNVYHHHYLMAFWFMAITVLIDAVDGSLARLVHVKSITPKFDGALLDNIIDYLNYVITPSFFLLVKPGMLPEMLGPWVILLVTLTSAYQFCQADAKTPDHFFKGFPCYWNFAVFYMFIFQTTMLTNTLVLIILSILIFIPIKYVYPSRLDYLTASKSLKLLMHACVLAFGISSALLLLNYPERNPLCLYISLGYVVLYLSLSIYRTFYPLQKRS